MELNKGRYLVHFVVPTVESQLHGHIHDRLRCHNQHALILQVREDRENLQGIDCNSISNPLSLHLSTHRPGSRLEKCNILPVNDARETGPRGTVTCCAAATTRRSPRMQSCFPRLLQGIIPSACCTRARARAVRVPGQFIMSAAIRRDDHHG
jgi:hypothetical protein